MAGNVIDELVNTLYETIDDAPAVPLSSKCIIEREKALDILEEIRANLPGELKMASEIVEKRKDFIDAGQREYDSKVKQAEEMAKNLVREYEADRERIWETNIFGKTLYDLVKEGMNAKLAHMPDESRAKLGETIEKIINDGANGLICILL